MTTSDDPNSRNDLQEILKLAYEWFKQQNGPSREEIEKE
jgi:hypothetical protein